MTGGFGSGNREDGAVDLLRGPAQIAAYPPFTERRATDQAAFSERTKMYSIRPILNA